MLKLQGDNGNSKVQHVSMEK